MDADETAVLRLRADGLSYRQIAEQLGIPLTRAYKLAQQAVGPESEPEPAPAAPPAQEGVVIQGLRSGSFRMPTAEEVRRGYTMPGPGGTVYVITGRG